MSDSEILLLASDEVLVEGGGQLNGEVRVDCNKHGLTLACAGAIATGSLVTVANAPSCLEMTVMAKIFNSLGGKIAWLSEGVVVIDGRITETSIPDDLNHQIHGSMYLIPAILGRFGRAEFSKFGGDQLGRFEFGLGRPIGHLLAIVEQFGGNWTRKSDGRFELYLAHPNAARIDIHNFSDDPRKYGGSRVSSATKFALLLAMAAAVEVIIVSAHIKEAETDLLFLASAIGYEVQVVGSDIYMRPPKSGVQDVKFEVMSDPAEIMTWAVLAGITRSSVKIVGPRLEQASEHFAPEFDALSTEWRTWMSSDSLSISDNADFTIPDRIVAESNGISTDSLPFLALLACFAQDGRRRVLTDRVWPGRFGYAQGLSLLGLDLTVRDDCLLAEGSIVRRMPGDRFVEAADTRSVAVLLVAALAIRGRTVVRGVDHVRRGYGQIEAKIRGLGANLSWGLPQ